jgi:hypothetical protein
MILDKNNLTKTNLKSYNTCVNTIKTEVNTNCLRMPNSFDIPLTNTYIQQGTYASLAEKQHKRKTYFIPSI